MNDNYGFYLVIATTIIYVPIGGLLSSFGSLIDDYDNELCFPNGCLDLLGLISALSLSNYRLLCGLSVYFEEKWGPLVVFVIGFILCVTSVFTTSIVTNIWQLLVTYAILYGFGSTFMLNSPYTIIEKYFPSNHKYHVLATSIINVGPPIGVFILNPVMGVVDKSLTDPLTWRLAMRGFGLVIVLVTSFYMIVVTISKLAETNTIEQYRDIDEDDNNVNQEQCSDDINTNYCFDLKCWLWIIALFLVSFAIFIPKTNFIVYTESIGINKYDATFLVAYSGITEAVFTLIVSLTGDFMKLNILWLYVICSFILAISNSLLPFFHNYYILGVYISVQGAADGIMLTVLYSVTGLLTDSHSMKRFLWAATNAVIGTGQVLGLPLAGLLYGKYNEGIFYLSTGVFGIATVVFLLVTFLIYKPAVYCKKHSELSERTSLNG